MDDALTPPVIADFLIQSLSNKNLKFAAAEELGGAAAGVAAFLISKN